LSIEDIKTKFNNFMIGKYLKLEYFPLLSFLLQLFKDKNKNIMKYCYLNAKIIKTRNSIANINQSYIENLKKRHSEWIVF
jgi:hypothetical protein